jgi:hypothetical protein
MMSSTPSSAASPANIAPAPVQSVKTPSADNMGAVALDASIPVSGIGPTKNWVIPPRPKPGRKPATDTPPTKRKAQNRAAQRAFRERRAARVGELEEQLKETEEERQKRETTMHNQIALQSAKISKLEEDVQRFSEEANIWRDRYFELQRKFEDESKEKDAAFMEMSYLRNGSKATGTNAVPLPPRRQQNPQNNQTAPVMQNEVQTDLSNEPRGCGGCTATSSCACLETAMSIATSGCGKCTAGSHCECLDETLKAAEMEITMGHELKRPLSTCPASDDIKRPRFSIEQPPHHEIDFTAQFSQTRPRLMTHRSSQDHLIPSSTAAPAESCGFCAEGTYCACAEALEAPNAVIEAVCENRPAPLLNEVTPPPSDTDGNSPDVHGVKLPSLHPNHRIHHSLQSGSDNTATIPNLLKIPAKQPYSGHDSTLKGPGSCKQCQEDPRSGLFCRSLAAMRASNGSTSEMSGDCCGGLNAADGGCCRKQDSSSSLTLSCADTYKTLAIHKKFNQATDDISDWLPKLQTSLPCQTGRAPLDIEAASVMNVLKYFDVRFGRS